MKKSALIGALISAGALLGANASASDLNLNYDPAPLEVTQAETIWLASAADTMSSGGNASGSSTEPLFEESAFTANKMHKYLGLASITLAGLTILAPKPDKNDKDDYESSLHAKLGEAAAITGGAAVASGFVIHYKDLNWSKLSDPDTLHALLGTLGTMGYIMAVSTAPDAHGGAGALGAISMLTAIKITW